MSGDLGQRIRRGLGAVCIAALCVGSVEASTLYETDFPEASGLPANWSVINDVAGNPGWYVDGASNYRYNGGTNAASALDGTVVLSDGSTASALKNVVVTTEFFKSSSALTGLITHRQGTGGTQTFYHARLNGLTSLQLFRFVSGGAAQLGSTVTLSDSYTQGEHWKMVMTTLGGKDAQQVGALVYNELGQLVGQVRATTTSSLLTSGTAGVRGSNSSAWDTFNISTPTQITTAMGQGADTYVEFRTDQASSPTINHGTENTMQVKSGVSADELYRKSYLRYDLSSTNGSKVFSASLDLKVNNNDSSGNTFTVWGLVDGTAGDDDPSGTGWSETGVNWNNAPGNTTGNGVDSNAVLLGTFTGGTNDEVLRFTSEALVNFLNADHNGLVTFIITDAINGGFGDGNYLVFDSKEQSGGTAPALSLVLIPEPTSILVMIGMLLGVIRRRPAVVKVQR